MLVPVLSLSPSASLSLGMVNGPLHATLTHWADLTFKRTCFGVGPVDCWSSGMVMVACLRIEWSPITLAIN